MRKSQEVITNKTIAHTSAAVKRVTLGLATEVSQPIMAKFNLTYGATPSITAALQGLKSDGTWVELDSDTWTTGTPKYLRSAGQQRYRRYRLVTSAITNVTVDHAYIGIGTVEN